MIGYNQQPMTHNTIVVLDYGSQYSQLIARRIREANVYCEMFSWRADAERVMALNPRGIILSGGPNSVYDEGAPTLPSYVLDSGIPVLVVCVVTSKYHPQSSASGSVQMYGASSTSPRNQ